RASTRWWRSTRTRSSRATAGTTSSRGTRTACARSTRLSWASTERPRPVAVRAVDRARRVQAAGLFEVAERLVEAALGDQQHREVVVGVGEGRIGPQRRLVMTAGAVAVAAALEHEAQVHVRAGVARVESERSLVARRGLLRPSGSDQRVAEVVVQRRHLGV